jgi:undecaprenyl-diphosphatase
MSSASLPPDQRPQRARLVLLAVLVVAAPLAFLVDMPLANAAKVAGERVPGDIRNIVRLSEVFAHGSGVLLILLAAMAIDPRHWRVVPRLAIGAYGAGWTADLLKLVLARRRPNVTDTTGAVADSFLGFFAWRDAHTWQEALSRDIQSFPSGHAATAAGLACALSRLYPQASWFFAAMTILACCQRVAASAHYLSDVLAGAAVGVVVSLLLDQAWIARRLSTVENGGK